MALGGTSRKGFHQNEDQEDQEEEEEEEENGGRVLEAWERAYADERSWEDLQEDESGLLRPIDTKNIVHAQYRRRLLQRSSDRGARLQKGIIRYIYVVVDLSRAASETDYRPSRMAVVAKGTESFIREFFDQNPLSHLGLIIMKDGVCQRLTELGGSPDSQIKALMGKLDCSGDASLQNALYLVHSYLSRIPSYGHREVLILYSSLNTVDPNPDCIMETINSCKKAKIRCSIVGLSAEIYICRHLCEQTGGSYTVALDESHFKELLLEHAPPPPAIAEYAAASLIKMGFPQRGPEVAITVCTCHKYPQIGRSYACPNCEARTCELPHECRLCGLTLISSPQLARSYHHLFPVSPFEEVSLTFPIRLQQKLPQTCFGCQQSLLSHGSKSSHHVLCPKCSQHFCLDCDIYIHESLHNCPGCESQRQQSTPQF